jgi:hypothetical protein
MVAAAPMVANERNFIVEEGKDCFEIWKSE